MATELNTRLDFMPDYLRPPSDEPSTRSFMQAYEEARRESSPQAKVQLAQAQQQLAQRAALFPLQRQMQALEINEQVDKLDTAQHMKLDRVKTAQAMADVTRMTASIQDWANADDQVNEIGLRISQSWTPDLQKAFDGIQLRAENAKKAKDLATYRQTQAEAAKTRAEAALGNTFQSKVNAISSLQMAYDAAVADGSDPELAASLQAQLQTALTLGGRRGSTAAEVGEPVVKEVNGVKMVYVPGSKQVHVIKPEASKSEFMTKNLPALLRDGKSAEESVQTLDKAWGLLNQSAPSGNAPAVRTYDPTTRTLK